MYIYDNSYYCYCYYFFCYYYCYYYYYYYYIILYYIIYIWKELWPLKILRGPMGPSLSKHRQAAVAVADLTLGEISGFIWRKPELYLSNLHRYFSRCSQNQKSIDILVYNNIYIYIIYIYICWFYLFDTSICSANLFASSLDMLNTFGTKTKNVAVGQMFCGSTPGVKAPKWSMVFHCTKTSEHRFPLG